MLSYLRPIITRVLKNEAARIHNEYARQRDREKSLGDLTSCELLEIATMDKYFEGEHVFEVQGKPVVVNGDLIAEAIAKLSEDKRDIILLSYFLGMSDREISEYMNMVRQTVSRWRTKNRRIDSEHAVHRGHSFSHPLSQPQRRGDFLPFTCVITENAKLLPRNGRNIVKGTNKQKTCS